MSSPTDLYYDATENTLNGMPLPTDPEVLKRTLHEYFNGPEVRPSDLTHLNETGRFAQRVMVLEPPDDERRVSVLMATRGMNGVAFTTREVNCRALTPADVNRTDVLTWLGEGLQR